MTSTAVKNMPKMRIFYLITRSEPGGAQSHVLELLRGFKDRYELLLGTGETGFLLDAAQELNIPTIYFPSLRRNISVINDYKAYHEILSALKETKPDLVHCHSSKAGVLGRLAAHRLGINCVFTAHGWAFAEGTSWMRKLVAIIPERLLAHWTNRIITVSDTDRLLALRYHVGTPEKLVTIHNGISDTAPVDRLQTGNIPVTLIMVARFAPPKNFGQLLEAVAGINQEFRLQLVGDGPMLADMKQKADVLGLTDRVEFLGSRNDVDTLLSAADIYILISDWEGLPISIIEALRAGLPVVASNVGGIREMVCHEKNGLLVDRGSVDSIASSLRTLIIDKHLRLSMGKNGRLTYETRFSATRMLNSMQNMYGSL